MTYWPYDPLSTGADPGFEKGGGAGGLEASFRHNEANLGDFLKNLAQKRVGVRPLRPLWIRALGITGREQ